MNKKKNKGFSLIELIVVVAIMAVLVGVLAPTYLRYVEKTRLQKDNSAIAEVAQAMKVAVADEKLNTKIAATGDTGVTITTAATAGAKTLTFTGTPAGTAEASITAKMLLEDELKAVIGDTLTTTSNTYTESTTAIAITVKIENGIPKVSATGIIEEANGAPLTSKTY